MSNAQALQTADTGKEVARAQLNTLKTSLYPGASDQSIQMVLDYCVARKLDPLKKPCHIVPMRVKVNGEWAWRDTVMPGIYELRTTAMRTGLYIGQDEPEFGDDLEFKGVTVPSYVKIRVHRLHKETGEVGAFTGVARFSEYAGTTKDGSLNDRWSKAPYQMLEKCAEAAALRKAFPDELGGEHSAEEMIEQTSYRTIDDTGKPETAAPQATSDGKTATEKQVSLLQTKLNQKDLSAEALCKAFNIEALTAMPFASVNDALTWIAEQ